MMEQDPDVQASVFRQLLVGLPRTGKTTFLAALWHQVDTGEVKQALRLHKLHGDREYLNKIRDSWVGCREIERTRIGAEETVRMWLAEPGSSAVAEIVFPDLSGETFRDQWAQRRWSRAFVDLLDEAIGSLIFIR